MSGPLKHPGVLLCIMTTKEATERVNAALDVLYEHFDAVQVLGTWHEDGQTYIAAIGRGNAYARQAMAAEYAVRALRDDD